MTHTVILSPTAERELDEAYHWLLAQTPQHGPLWYNGLLDAILGLETSPARHPLARLRKKSVEPIRQLLYGDKHHAYRILFIIRENTVLILHIRHAARRNI
jgi:plasmid stabilization system protein ParE